LRKKLLPCSHLLRAATKPQASFNDENFYGKQVPFFEHVSPIAVIPFLAREDMHPRSSFSVDDATFALVKEKLVEKKIKQLISNDS
jgi:hypothetical protein